MRGDKTDRRITTANTKATCDRNESRYIGINFLPDKQGDDFSGSVEEVVQL